MIATLIGWRAERLGWPNTIVLDSRMINLGRHGADIKD